MPRAGFIHASRLLDKAAGQIEEAARAVTEESANAPHLTRPIDQLHQQAGTFRSVDDMAMEELTKYAVEMAQTARTIKGYSEGFGGESS